MRRLIRSALMIFVTVLCVSCFVGFNGADVYATTVLPADVSQPSDGCAFLGIKGSYLEDAQAALDTINEYRLEACKEGVKDPRDTSRTLTEDDYVPLQWSQSLQSIARLRAAETNPSFAMFGAGHNRVNGKSVFTTTYGGITSSAENLAWNSDTSVLGGIKQWYEEKDDWINDTGGVTGHYTSIINPNYKYIGVADFYADNKMNCGWRNVVCGVLSSREGSLGTGMLEPEQDIMQTVEVKESYLDGYTFLDTSTLYTDQQRLFVPLAKATASSGTGYFWLVDDYSLDIGDSDIATVDEDGIVTAQKAGSLDISVLSGGNTLFTQTITIACNHIITVIPAVPARVATPGKTAGKKCEKCNEVLVEPKTTAGLNPSKTSITSLTKASKAIKVKWKKSSSANATGYQIRYSLKSSMAGSKTVTVKGYKAYSKKISKLKAKKKYYVQVRCYKVGKSTTGKTMTYYSAWSPKKSVKTK